MNIEISSSMRRGLALALVAVTVPLVQAQQPGAVALAARPALVLDAAVQSPLAGLTYREKGTSSSPSSSIGLADMRAEDAAQPPPRRQYGRPTYHDNMHNADGSSKLAFEIGGGLTAPAGSTARHQKDSYRFGAGGGRQFNKTFGVLLQYDYDHFGITDGDLQKQLTLYNNLGSNLTALNGSTHIWSVTLNPIINYYTSDSFGAYVVGGGGFYRKVTTFTTPVVGTFCNYFCYQEAVDAQVGRRYTNNAGGASAGIGFTYKLSRFSGQKFFAEARYVWVDNQPSSNNTATQSQYYLPGNYRTGYFPVTIGLRW